ncbi:MAG: hypothetical protein M3Q09_12120 [Gemmatimonadota bacterium]|nr:hypothetical protein [Gemmatimonadota bacterium]
MQPPSTAPVIAQTSPQAPTTSATPTVGATSLAPAAPGTPSPSLVYEAARATRRALGDQVENLEQTRHQLLRELEDHQVPGAARTGMEQRIVQIDQRIAELDKTISTADAQVAITAAVPGAVVERPPPPPREGPPEEMFVIVPFVLLAAALPLSIAFARRIWRRAGVVPPVTFPRELSDRLSQLEQTAEATALEVERIGEGQRFVTRLLTEREKPALPQG